MNGDHAVEVGAGRLLAYREYGDRAGAVVVNCHGGLSCGIDVASFDAVARELGLRIVSPDRPGIGGSTAAPGRTTGGWAADVRALLDALDVERAALLGWSMGGQYALACAALLSGRVTRTAVIAGCLPLNDKATLATLNGMDRRFTRLARRHPRAAATLFRTLGQFARHAPGPWTRAVTEGAAPDEVSAIRALPEPGLAAGAAVALGGGHGMVEEFLAWARPWGFAAADIAGPVTIWQGDDDRLVPPAWGRELARTIPDARLELVPGAGHFLGYTRTREVLRGLVG
jgi:pimeloyl-ACP methyl ester carboxylesterase